MSVDIVTDYSAPTNGTSSASAAFASFRTAQQGNTGVVLTLGPPGTTYVLDTPEGDGSPFKIPKGIRGLTVVGDAGNPQTLLGNLTGSPSFSLGVQGQVDLGSNAYSARVVTVAAGASSVTVVTTGQASRFTVNTYALMAGGDCAGFGYPITPWVFEYVYITNITGDVITFSAPLRFSYKSTWPLYDGGSGATNDLGGPATLFVLDDSWDVQVEYQNIIVNQGQLQYVSPGRDVTFTNCEFLMDPAGSGVGRGVSPSCNLIWRMIGCTSTQGAMEIDKNITEMIFQDSALGYVGFQSGGCVDLCTFDNSTSTLIDGTPKKFVTTNGGTIDELRYGATGSGCTQEIRVDPTTTVSATVISGAIDYGDVFNADDIIVNGWTISGGTISIPSNHVPVSMVPGGYNMWTGKSGFRNQRMFRILDIRQSGSTTLVDTDWVGGFPPADSSGDLGVRAHPAPITYGIEDVDGVPFLSRRSYTFTSAALAGASVYGIAGWGYIKKLTIEVTQAANMDFRLSDFNNWPVILNSDGSFVNFGSAVSSGPAVNCNHLGARVYESVNGAAPSWSGVQTGDVLSDLGELFWFPDGSNSGSIFSSASSGATVIVSLETEQGITNQFLLSPLVLRLHS